MNFHELPYIFLTTPTSATGSFIRLLRAIRGDAAEIANVAASFYESGNLPGLRSFIPDAGRPAIHVWNTPEHWNENIPLEQFHFILNFRDPRDLVCNQYYWALLHDNPLLTPEARDQFRQRVRDRGLADFVLDSQLTNDNRRRFSSLISVASKLGKANFVTATYAQICLRFDDMIHRLCNTLGVPVTPDLLDRVAPERPENLLLNTRWNATTGWMTGSDQSPGRYMLELDEDTIRRLEVLYAEELRFCAEHEMPPLDRLYATSRTIHGASAVSEPVPN